jgi:hypothetical protein
MAPKSRPRIPAKIPLDLDLMFNVTVSDSELELPELYVIRNSIVKVIKTLVVFNDILGPLVRGTSRAPLDGMIWVGEFNGGKIARFDPRTQTFKEYLLPGPAPTPYGMGFDADGYLWYDSHFMDVLGRFDTRTGKVIEYPVPHSEISMREFFRDGQGQMWYGSSSNDKIGYFCLTNKGDGSGSASK